MSFHRFNSEKIASPCVYLSLCLSNEYFIYLTQTIAYSHTCEKITNPNEMKKKYEFVMYSVMSEQSRIDCYKVLRNVDVCVWLCYVCARLCKPNEIQRRMRTAHHHFGFDGFSSRDDDRFDQFGFGFWLLH